MAESSITAFFYGLYMDEKLLREKGVDPRSPRRAVAPGFRLRIGAKVYLSAQFGAQAFGMAFSLTQAELHSLYAGSGLDMYKQEAVLVQFEDGSFAPVATFNLTDPLSSPGSNPEYAAKLRMVLKQLGFPDDDAATIE